MSTQPNPTTPHPTGAADEAAPVPLDSAKPSLGDTVARGATWMLAQNVVTKLVTFGSAAAQTYLLTREDVGRDGYAATIAGLLAFVLRPGVEDALQQKGTEWRAWLGPALGVSVASSIVAALLLLAVAPFAAAYWETGQLYGLVSVYAVGALAQGVATVPLAALGVELRFRAIALVITLQSVLGAAMMLTLAWLGAGPYALGAGLTVATFTAAVVAWSVLRPPAALLAPQFGKWPTLLRDMRWLTGARAVQGLAGNGDYVVVGKLFGAADLGVYTYALRQGGQVVRLLGINLAVVMFPSLGSLSGDPRRQYEVFMGGSRLIALVAVPMVAAQVALARPLFEAALAVQWRAAIGPFQVLSLAGVCGVMLTLNSAMLRARLNNAADFAVTALYAVCVVVGALVGGKLFGLIGACWGALAAQAVTTWVSYLAIKVRWQGRWRDVWDVLARPALIGAAGGVAAWAATLPFPRAADGEWRSRLVALGTLGVGLAVWFVASTAAAYAIDPERTRELVARLRRAARRGA